MTQMFDDKRNVVPVTLIEAGPCFVTQLKTKEGKDRYDSVQIGFQSVKEKKIKKSQKKRPYRYVKEFQADSAYNVGEKIDASVFKEGDVVKISGISKGKGFAGVIKKWKFHSKPASHGTKHEERAMGSKGPSFPHKIKGRKMPGRMGYDRVTVKSVKIKKVDSENNLIAILGAVPGRKGTLLEITG